MPFPAPGARGSSCLENEGGSPASGSPSGIAEGSLVVSGGSGLASLAAESNEASGVNEKESLQRGQLTRTGPGGTESSGISLKKPQWGQVMVTVGAMRSYLAGSFRMTLPHRPQLANCFFVARELLSAVFPPETTFLTALIGRTCFVTGGITL